MRQSGGWAVLVLLLLASGGGAAIRDFARGVQAGWHEGAAATQITASASAGWSAPLVLIALLAVVATTGLLITLVLGHTPGLMRRGTAWLAGWGSRGEALVAWRLAVALTMLVISLVSLTQALRGQMALQADGRLFQPPIDSLLAMIAVGGFLLHRYWPGAVVQDERDQWIRLRAARWGWHGLASCLLALVIIFTAPSLQSTLKATPLLAQPAGWAQLLMTCLLLSYVLHQAGMAFSYWRARR